MNGTGAKWPFDRLFHFRSSGGWAGLARFHRKSRRDGLIGSYQQAMRRPSHARPSIPTSVAMATKTLLERLALEEKGLAAHLDAFRKTASALESLYDVLTPDQKKAADEIVVGPMGMPIGLM